VDVLATSEMHGFQWRGSRLCRKELSYEIVVYPFPEIIDADVYRVLRQRSDRVILAFEQSYAFASGRRANFTSPRFGLTVPDLLALLGTHPELRPVLAPAGTWVTMTPCEVGMIVSVAPSRCSGTYSGRIALAGNEVNVGLTSDLRRFFFPQAGDPFELNEHTHPE
jgi:hypothetical protein